MFDKIYYEEKIGKLNQKLLHAKDKCLQKQLDSLQEYINSQSDINEEILEINKQLEEFKVPTKTK